MTPHPDDTIVALSSAPGPGLRAIVRVSGPETAVVVGKVFRASDLTPPAPLSIHGEGGVQPATLSESSPRPLGAESPAPKGRGEETNHDSPLGIPSPLWRG